MNAPATIARSTRSSVRLFLCGDVMTGRGIDQILPHPSDPVLHESYMQSAADYVGLAETANGPIPRGVEPAYVWGAALDEFDRMQPDVRIVNLETSITRSEDYALKGINYRMNPDNADILPAAGIDCCVLGNNHVLDWGRSGLIDTLTTLERLQIKIAGAGRNLAQASAPAALDIPQRRRVLVFSLACASSGTPRSWAAQSAVPGVNFLSSVSDAGARQVAAAIKRMARPDDLIVVSVHWGPNWGYEIPDGQRNFAHALIDQAEVAIIHGHSSHHPKAIEVYRGRLVLYGCGDFLDDYEGISGYEQYRDDLVLMYFADIDQAGALVALDLVPLQIRNFRLARPSPDDVRWLQQTLDRESRKFGARVALRPDGRLTLSPSASAP
ncbi:MAG TPA: CapA family protein [Xanthobacteraceae bacterium]|nr:CapA family protein [Xanthobacteraceae bacterium]